MNKKQKGSAILAGIAITAILVASSLIAGNQFTQQAHAQATTTTSSNATTSRSAAGGQGGEPRTGQTVNWQGTVASVPSPLPGHKEDVAVILPPRKAGGLYTGVITWTASKSVSAQVWNELSGVSATTPLNTKTFGKLAISPSGNKLFATATVGTGDTSGSVPFAGNAVALVGKSPFIATYSVTAQATPGKVTNNLTSATALAGAAGGTLGGGGTTGPLTLGTSPSGSSSGGGSSSSGGGTSGSSGGSSSGGSSS